MSGFRFKQFYVAHDRCAMKVGTDGILLGALADVANAKRILDLGTGTGLVALMLAQRNHSNVQIQGVELDPAAAQQATENVQASPWTEKVQIVQQDIAAFTQNCGAKFDLIVANPPYFAQGVDCANAARQTARYAQQSHLDWLNFAESCLNEKGKIQFILPFDAAEILIKSTALCCAQRIEIITKQGKSPQRMLVTFQREFQPTETSQLIIYDPQNQYTQEFVALTKAFYLKM